MAEPIDQRKAKLTYAIIEALIVPRANPDAGISKYTGDPATRIMWTEKLNGPFALLARPVGYVLSGVTSGEVQACATVRDLMRLVYSKLTRVAPSNLEFAVTHTADDDSALQVDSSLDETSLSALFGA